MSDARLTDVLPSLKVGAMVNLLSTRDQVRDIWSDRTRI